MAAIATQLAAVRERIAVACARADRRPESVRLLAVSKTYGPDAVSEASPPGSVALAKIACKRPQQNSRMPRTSRMAFGGASPKQ